MGKPKPRGILRGGSSQHDPNAVPETFIFQATTPIPAIQLEPQRHTEFTTTEDFQLSSYDPDGRVLGGQRDQTLKLRSRAYCKMLLAKARTWRSVIAEPTMIATLEQVRAFRDSEASRGLRTPRTKKTGPGRIAAGRENHALIPFN